MHAAVNTLTPGLCNGFSDLLPLPACLPPFHQGATDSEGRPVDAELYRTFWGLQAYFSDPPRALQAGSWARVATGEANRAA